MPYQQPSEAVVNDLQNLLYEHGVHQVRTNSGAIRALVFLYSHPEQSWHIDQIRAVLQDMYGKEYITTTLSGSLQKYVRILPGMQNPRLGMYRYSNNDTHAPQQEKGMEELPLEEKTAAPSIQKALSELQIKTPDNGVVYGAIGKTHKGTILVYGTDGTVMELHHLQSV